jgi:peroxiredoxin
LKDHYRYSFRYLLFLSLIIFLPIFLTACSSSGASELKITTRDQAAELDKALDTQQNSWIEQAAPAVEEPQPAQDNPVAEPGQPQMELVANNPEPTASEVEANPLPTATVTQPPEATTAAPQAAQPVTQAALPPTDVKVGFSAPNFSMTTLDGKTVQLSDLLGQNVLINYWVTWCDPCLEELGFLDKIGQEYQARGFTILSVNGLAQNPLPDVEAVVNQNGLTFPILLDENDGFYQSYLVKFLPTSFFIDENGVIRHIQLGSASEDIFRTKIEQLLSDQL